MCLSLLCVQIVYRSLDSERNHSKRRHPERCSVTQHTLDCVVGRCTRRDFTPGCAIEFQRTQKGPTARGVYHIWFRSLKQDLREERTSCVGRTQPRSQLDQGRAGESAIVLSEIRTARRVAARENKEEQSDVFGFDD